MKNLLYLQCVWRRLVKLKWQRYEVFMYFAGKDPVTLEAGVWVSSRREIMLGSLLFHVLATGASKCVSSCFRNTVLLQRQRQALAELFYPCTTCFEPLLAYFFTISVQVTMCTPSEVEFGNWLLAVWGAIETCQVHYKRGIGASALKSRGHRHDMLSKPLSERI